jgi:hypothetical protein
VALYCDSHKIESPEVREHLSEVTIKDYTQIVGDNRKHVVVDGNKVWVDKSRSNLALSMEILEKALVDC